MYVLNVDLNEVRATVDRITLPEPSTPQGQRLGLMIRKIGNLVQVQAIWNVSDHPVFYDGNAFKVRPQTGALKGAIELEWPFQTTYSARVYVNGMHTAVSGQPGARPRIVPVSRYAAAIEFGHGEIDLKRTMRGKIVPFFAARSQSATGPYAAAGLQPLGSGEGSQSVGSRWRPTDREPRTNKLRAAKLRNMVFTQKGRPTTRGGSGTYYIAFRRVGSTGWIIPRARPRPFMGATMSQVKEPVRKEMRAAMRDIIHGTT